MDIRLGWLALSLWISTAISIGIETRLHPTWVVVWLIVAATGIQLARKHFQTVRTDYVTIAKFSILGVLLGLAVASIRVLPIISGPIAEASKHSQIVHGEGVIASDPIVSERREALDWSASELIRVTVTVTQIDVHGQTSTLRLPVMAFSSDPETISRLRVLAPGQRIAFVGKLNPPIPGRAIAANLSLTDQPVVLERPPKYQWLAAELRRGLHKAMTNTSDAAKGLVPGLALGDSSELDPDLAVAMKSSGLTHLIAVSGTNVTLLIVVVLAMLRRSGLAKGHKYLIALFALCAFVVVVRPQPSVLRATVMGLVALIAGYTGSKKSPLPALCLAVIALVVIDPWLAVSYGFALSVAATFGLLLWSEKLLFYLDQRVPRLVPGWVIETLAITICAQLAVFPLMIALGSQVSLISIPANMIAVPLAGPAMLLGVLTALAAPISLPIAKLVAEIAALPANVIAGVAMKAAQVDWLTIPWPKGIMGVSLAVALLLNVIQIGWRWRRLSNNQRSSLISLGVAALILIWMLPTVNFSQWPNRDWVMVACDVGQGDAAVIKVGRNSGVVVDVGGDPELIDQCLDRLNIETIPLLLLTHFHADHVGGLEGALRNRRVGEIRVSPLADPPETTKFVQQTLARMQMHSNVMTYPERFQVNGIEFECVWPSRLILGEGSDPNNASVALLVRTQGVSIFMTGDIEPAVQNAIMRQLGTIHVDVLKVAHHGSRNQSGPFAAWVRAPVALISAGIDNDYGHPAPETIALYELTGSEVFRTDLQGDLAVLVTGGQLRVATRN